MYVLISSSNGTLNDLEVRSYYTVWGARQAMWAEFIHVYEDFYNSTEAPRDEDNGCTYYYTSDRAVLSLDEPDTPEWAIVEVED